MPEASRIASEIGTSMFSRRPDSAPQPLLKKGCAEKATVGSAIAAEIQWNRSRVASVAPDQTATESSITLAAATLGLVHVPGPPVEACIALSIVFVASEIVHGQQGRPGLTARAPWVVAFTFGLLHGFGFAGALTDIGLPEHAIPLALLFFNLGVEAGQLVFIAAVLAGWFVLGRIGWPAWAWRVPVYGIGALAAFWTVDRISGFA